MAIVTKKLYQRLLPNLEFYIRIPFLRVSTAVFRESLEMWSTEWVRLTIELWKWSFSFNLYSPQRYWINRNDGPNVVYYRIDDELYDFLKKVKEHNEVIGLDWAGDRTIGFVVNPTQPQTDGEEN